MKQIADRAAREREHLIVQIPKDVKERFRRIAAADDRSMSSQLRVLLADYVAEREKVA